MKNKPVIGEFHDITRFPPEEGLLLLPISMSRISNESQNSQTYIKYLEHFNKKIPKTQSPEAKVGAVFIYTESLYLHSDKASTELKSKYLPLINNHKNSMVNLLSKHFIFIQDAFSYLSWSQLYLLYKKDFNSELDKLKKIYQNDKLFQKYLKQDFEELKMENKKLDENQINFFLEEHLMTYLLAKGEIQLPNNFINEKEKWILLCYPGKPLKAQTYVHQKNFFKLDNKKNKYQNSWYDLSSNKLYNFNEINLI